MLTKKQRIKRKTSTIWINNRRMMMMLMIYKKNEYVINWHAGSESLWWIHIQFNWIKAHCYSNSDVCVGIKRFELQIEFCVDSTMKVFFIFSNSFFLLLLLFIWIFSLIFTCFYSYFGIGFAIEVLNMTLTLNKSALSCLLF